MARLRRASFDVRSQVESGLAGDAALLRVRHRGLRGASELRCPLLHDWEPKLRATL
jgi:hypothetical protein